MSLDFQTHKYKKRPNSNLVELDKVNPYVRMVYGADTYIFLQAGNVYGGGGEFIDIEDVPGWVWDKMKTMNPKVLAEVGWDEKFKDAMKQLGEPVEDEKPKSKERGKWTCKQCGEEMDKNQRLAHTMKHRRADKEAEKAKED